MATMEEALLLIELALANGIKHYSNDGKPLTTVLEVVQALQRDGSVQLKDPE